MATDSSPLSIGLRDAVAALENATLRYALMGAMAAIAWGRPRTTLDIDIVVDASISDVRSAFAPLGWREGRAIGDDAGAPDFTQWWTDLGVRIDVFFARTDFEREAVATAERVGIGDVKPMTVNAESSIIYKLIAHRGRDLDDVEAIFLARAKAIDWARLERWSKEWELEQWLSDFRVRFNQG